MKSRFCIFVLLLAGCARDFSNQSDSEPKQTLFPVWEGQGNNAFSGRVGYVNVRGQLVIPFQFDSAGDFSANRARVFSGTHWEFIDSRGKPVIGGRYDDVTWFHDGLAAVKVGTRWGYVDSLGAEIISPQFDIAGDFWNETAPVKLGSKWGYINKRGKLVVAAKYDNAYPMTGDGLAMVRLGSHYGFVDSAGSYAINPQYADAWGFSEGLAPVKIGDRWGFIDREGRIAIPAQFDDASSFSDSLAKVKLDSLVGFIDRRGHYAIEPQFKDAEDFKAGVASVTTNERCGFMDRRGSYVVNPRYTLCFRGAGDIFLAIRDDSGYKTLVYVDTAGKEVWVQSRASRPPTTSGPEISSRPAGQMNEVRMIGDARGYRYEPRELTIRSGDSVRFVVASGGPHNVAFDPASVPDDTENLLNANIPERMGHLSSSMKMNAGETIVVSFQGIPPGIYTYHCVPHLALGMAGEITVIK